MDKQFYPNTTQTPNWIFDKAMRELTSYEFLCLMVVVRKTYGWHKQRDRISLSQFTEMTGTAKTTVIRALKTLLQKGYLVRDSEYRYLVAEQDQYHNATDSGITALPDRYHNATKTSSGAIHTKLNKLTNKTKETKEDANFVPNVLDMDDEAPSRGLGGNRSSQVTNENPRMKNEFLSAMAESLKNSKFENQNEGNSKTEYPKPTKYADDPRRAHDFDVGAFLNEEPPSVRRGGWSASGSRRLDDDDKPKTPAFLSAKRSENLEATLQKLQAEYGWLK